MVHDPTIPNDIELTRLVMFQKIFNPTRNTKPTLYHFYFPLERRTEAFPVSDSPAGSARVMLFTKPNRLSKFITNSCLKTFQGLIKCAQERPLGYNII